MLADMSMEPDGVELADDVASREPEDEVEPAAAFNSSSSLRFLRLLLDEEDEEFTDFDESSQGFSESESEASGPPGGRRRGGAADSFAFAATTTTSTVFSQARGQLQLSVLPKTLPCREAERKNLHALLRDALANNTTCSICM
jgi:hypothetical protein